MVTLLVGASGLLGTALKAKLPGPLRQLVRRPLSPADDPDTHVWDPARPLAPEVLDNVTAVVNLGGAGVGDKRWTTSRLELLRSSRTIPTATLATAIAAHPEPIRYLQASAVGFYGDTGDHVTTEAGTAGETILSDLTAAWEHAAAPAIEAGQNTAFLRTGIVLSSNGGALAPLLPLIRLGLGGPLGSGKQWWPWIHVDDWVNAVAFLLDQDLTGPVNLTAATPERNRTVTKEIARTLRRPAVVPVPGFALRLVLGGFADEILRSQRVVPAALLEAGFSFTYPEISSAAQALTRSTT